MQSVLTPPEAEIRARRPTPETCRRAAALARRHGALLLRQAFSPSLLERVRQVVIEGGSDWHAGEGLRDLGPGREHLSVRIAPPFDDPAVYADPACLGVLRALLGRRFVINSISVVTTLPGAPAAQVDLEHPPLHGSDELREALPPFALTLFVPLGAMDSERGSVRVWEGSHLLHRDEALAGGSTLVEADLGDCLFLDHRVWRADTSAPAPEPRHALSIVYARPWFRDHRNLPPDHLVAISRSEHARLPDDHQGLFLLGSR